MNAEATTGIRSGKAIPKIVRRDIAIALFAATFAVVALLSLQSFSAPKTYEDCVISNMQSSMSDKAAILLAQVCNGKYDTIEERRVKELSAMPFDEFFQKFK